MVKPAAALPMTILSPAATVPVCSRWFSANAHAVLAVLFLQMRPSYLMWNYTALTKRSC